MERAFRPKDAKTAYTDTIVIKHAKSGEEVALYRSQILYFSARTRAVREKAQKAA